MEGAPHLHRLLDGHADTDFKAGAQCWWHSGGTAHAVIARCT